MNIKHILIACLISSTICASDLSPRDRKTMQKNHTKIRNAARALKANRQSPSEDHSIEADLKRIKTFQKKSVRQEARMITRNKRAVSRQ